MSKILSLLTIAIMIISSMQIHAAEHLTHPDYSGSNIEYREYLGAEDLSKLCQGIRISYPITWKSDDDYSESIESRKFLKAYLTEFCEGYIAAAAEAYDGMTAKGGWRFCLRSSASKSEILKNVIAYLNTHEEYTSKTAISTIASALSERYACNIEDNISEHVYLAANELLTKCKTANKGFCTGYIQGVIDAYDNWETKSGERFCGVGYRLWFSVFQLYTTLCEVTNVEEQSALEIVTSSIKHTCDVSIERGLGCRDPARCEIR